jgi:hypothetical protein
MTWVKMLAYKLYEINWRKILLLNFKAPLRATDLQLIWGLWSLFLGGLIGIPLALIYSVGSGLAAAYALSILILRFMQNNIGRGTLYADKVQKTLTTLSESPVQMAWPDPVTVMSFDGVAPVARFFKGKFLIEEAVKLIADLKKTILNNFFGAVIALLFSIFTPFFKDSSSSGLDWFLFITTLTTAVLSTISWCGIWIPIQEMAKRNDAFSS